MTDLLLAAYAGAALLAFWLIEAPLWQRVLSAAVWPTFPLWPLFQRNI